jgi:hypothetical protein
MELDQLLSTLRARRAAIALIVVLATAAGVVAAYRVDGMPPHFVARAGERGEATRQVVVDSKTPLFAATKGELNTLIGRAPFFAQVMTSGELRRRTARAMGLPASTVTTEGPFRGPAAVLDTDVPAEARAHQLAAESVPYRLSFIWRTGLPVFTIHAEAPSRLEAARLAGAALTALQGYTSDLYAKLVVKPKRPIIIRPLGGVSTSVRGGRTSQIQLVLVAMSGVLAGLLILVSVEEMRRRVGPGCEARPDLTETTA